MSVLVVTGVGGPAGVSVVRSLRGAGHRVIGVDIDPMAVGLRLCDEGVVVPRFADEAFVPFVVELAERVAAEALISTVAEEMIVLNHHLDDFRAAGLACWVPSIAAVTACIDKWEFARVLAGAGIDAPCTGLGTVTAVPGPWIVKPRNGRGSRDVYTVDDESELDWALRRVADPIVQTRIDGREFTVDALVDRDSRLAGAVPRWRLETKAGISTKGRTFRSNAVEEAVRDTLAAVGLTGPANVQGFVRPDNTVAIVEVNPRFSGGLPLSLAAGADLVGEFLRGVMGETIRPENLRFRADVTMLRHFEEIIEG